MTFSLAQTFPPASATNGDFFGVAVAVSRDGSTLVVGANHGGGAGAKAYVYSGPGFATETVLSPSDGASGDLFGQAVAVSADGSVVVVGAPGARNGSTVGHHHGAVYVYNGAALGTETKLSSSDPTIDSRFGRSVAISDDGATIAAGANGWTSSKGKAYVRTGASWATETGLVASDGSNGDQFGIAIAISASGAIVAIGTLGAKEAYVRSGAAWATETKIIPVSALASSFFGEAVALSANGVILAVGDGQANGIFPNGTGGAFIYSGAAYATELALLASDGEPGDAFGVAVALSPFGDILAVGATNAPNSGASFGKAYVFTGGGFATEQIIDDPDAASGDTFGISASFGIARQLLVGAQGVAGGFDAGAAYLYSTPSPSSSIAYQRIYGIPIDISDNSVEQVNQLLTSPDGFSP